MSTNLAMLGVPQPVTEALLNHKTGVVSGIAAIYNVYSYADEKREALGAWSQQLMKLVRSKHGATESEIAKAGLVAVWCRSFDSVMCGKGDEPWAQ
jgi:hypothetical protein